MSIFSEPTPSNAYLKAGFLGFQGSGKTYTAVMLMIGVVEYLRKLERPEADKPVYFLDTETGFDYVKRHFDRHGIKTLVARTRAFADLKPAILEAEANGVGLIADSVTHYWNEFMESYLRKTKRKFIQFDDWRYLKQKWNEDFATMYVNSKIHFTVCGRAGYEYDYHEREDGKKELEKTGIKMKTEGEFGYEPSLLVLMERNIELDTKKVSRQAHVLKERFSVIDGKTFDFTGVETADEDSCRDVFRAFMPHIKLLNLGGQHLGVDTTRNSEAIVPDPDRSFQNEQQQRVIWSEEIAELLKKHYPSQSVEDKQKRADAMEQFFGTRSWTAIENMHSDKLKKSYADLKKALEPENNIDAEQEAALAAVERSVA